MLLLACASLLRTSFSSWRKYVVVLDCPLKTPSSQKGSLSAGDVFDIIVSICRRKDTHAKNVTSRRTSRFQPQRKIAQWNGSSAKKLQVKRSPSSSRYARAAIFMQQGDLSSAKKFNWKVLICIGQEISMCTNSVLAKVLAPLKATWLASYYLALAIMDVIEIGRIDNIGLAGKFWRLCANAFRLFMNPYSASHFTFYSI